MSDGQPPSAVVRLLEQRAAARAERDWQAADALRDEIRGLGWDPIDTASGSTARPIPPEPTGEHASILDQPAELDLTLVAVVDDHPEDLLRLAAGLRSHPPPVPWELLVVDNGPAALTEATLDELPATVLQNETRLGWADTVNLGLRRARGAVITLLDTSVEPIGDIATPLLAAFDDPLVGIAGPWGVISADGRHFAEAPAGEVDAVEAYCLAVRREALASVGGFDHRFRWYRNADLDLSFAVRDAGWRAVATGPLPLRRHEHRGYAALPPEERDRLSKRNFYRFLDHWGDRRDLLLRPADQ